jgi:hypothetical protein
MVEMSMGMIAIIAQRRTADKLQVEFADPRCDLSAPDAPTYGVHCIPPLPPISTAAVPKQLYRSCDENRFGYSRCVRDPLNDIAYASIARLRSAGKPAGGAVPFVAGDGYDCFLGFLTPEFFYQLTVRLVS